MMWWMLSIPICQRALGIVLTDERVGTKAGGGMQKPAQSVCLSVCPPSTTTTTTWPPGRHTVTGKMLGEEPARCRAERHSRGHRVWSRQTEVHGRRVPRCSSCLNLAEQCVDILGRNTFQIEFNVIFAFKTPPTPSARAESGIYLMLLILSVGFML